MISLTNFRTFWANTQKDFTIIKGVFNARIGEDNIRYQEVIGTHGLGEISEKREKFIDICVVNELVIGGRIFSHKKIHKAAGTGITRTYSHSESNRSDLFKR